MTGMEAPALPLLKSVSCTVAPPLGDCALTATPGVLGVEVYVQFMKSARAWLAAAASKTITAVKLRDDSRCIRRSPFRNVNSRSPFADEPANGADITLPLAPCQRR